MIRNGFVVFTILLVIGFNCKTADAAPKTNDEIYQTLLSLVHSYSLLDNKLERHENRERAAADIIKKSLLHLQKNQRVFEPLKGTILRLEERLSAIETIIMNSDLRQNDQSAKLADALRAVLDFMQGKDTASSTSTTDEFDELEKKISDLNDNVGNLRKEIAQLKSQKIRDDAKLEKIVDGTEKLINLQESLNTPDEYVTRIEEKLNSFYITHPVTTPEPPAPIVYDNKEWESKIENMLTTLNVGVKDVIVQSSNVSSTIRAIGEKEMEPIIVTIDKEFIESINKNTAKSIDSLKMELYALNNQSHTSHQDNWNRTNELLDISVKHLLNKLNETLNTTTNTNTQSPVDIDKLLNAVKSLEKIDEILLLTGENILDTKRRVEFGVLQVIAEIKTTLKENADDMNATVHQRFNNMSQTLVHMHDSIVANVSTEIESEMGQMWRQISIIVNELSSTRTSLDKLQRYSELYVNGTVHTIGDAEEKIASMKDRLEEMFSNLNYLLGRLSLVNQEFNGIKTGLGSAIDNLKTTFQLVKESIPDAGAGPHNIPLPELEGPIPVDDDDLPIPKTNLVKRLALPYKK